MEHAASIFRKKKETGDLIDLSWHKRVYSVADEGGNIFLRHVFVYLSGLKVSQHQNNIIWTHNILNTWKCNVGCKSSFFFFLPVELWPKAGHGPFILQVFRSHTATHTVGRTSLDEWSARSRDPYLTIHDNHNRKISMTPAGFEPKVSADEWP
jgi:hypothetical protein